MTPDGWRTRRLGEISEILIGGTPARNNPAYWDVDKSGQNRWAAISDLKGRFLSDTAEYITDLGVQKSNVKLIPSGTPLMSFKLSIGRTALTKTALFTNEAIAAFLPRESFDPAFLAYALPRAAENSAEADQAVKGKTLNKAKLTELELLLPPFPEQKKIAAILSSVDEAIEATQAVVDQLQVVKKAMMGELLTKGIPGRHSRFKKTEIGEVPEGWVIAPLADLCLDRARYGANVPKRPFEANGLRYVRITDITSNGELSPDDVVGISEEDGAPYRLSEGDILFARSGATVGKTYVYRRSDGPCAHAGYLIRFRPDPARLDVRFMGQVVQSERYWIWVKEAQRAQAQPNINAQEFGSLLVPVPSLDEQMAIIDVLGACDERRICESAQLEGLRELKAALLSVLLTGEVRVRVEGEEAGDLRPQCAAR